MQLLNKYIILLVPKRGLLYINYLVIFGCVVINQTKGKFQGIKNSKRVSQMG